MDKEFEQYRTEVMKYLLHWADDDPPDMFTKATQEMLSHLDEIGDDSPLPYFSAPYQDGFTPYDAAKSIIFCADIWDETWACERQERLSAKYRLTPVSE